MWSFPNPAPYEEGVGTVLSITSKSSGGFPGGTQGSYLMSLKTGKPKGPSVWEAGSVWMEALAAEPTAVASMAPKAGGDVPLRSPLRLGLSEPRDIGVRASVYMGGVRRGYLQEKEELASKGAGGAVLNSSLL